MMMRRLAAAGLVTAVAFVVGCGGGDNSGGGDAASSGDLKGTTVTVWSNEGQPDPSRCSRTTSPRSPSKTGIKVKVVAAPENQFTHPHHLGRRRRRAARRGRRAARRWRDGDGNDLRHRRRQGGRRRARPRHVLPAGAGADTTGRQASSPCRPTAGASCCSTARTSSTRPACAAPDTFDKIRAAAQKLNTGGVAGITLATVPNDAFTAQTFENFALGNNCQLVDDAKNVTLDSPQCVETFQLYGDLVANFSVPGAQDVDTTRARTSPARRRWWSGRRSCSTRWPACATTRSRPARSARPTRRSWPRTAGSSPIGGPGGQPAQFGETLDRQDRRRRRPRTRASSSST